MGVGGAVTLSLSTIVSPVHPLRSAAAEGAAGLLYCCRTGTQVDRRAIEAVFYFEQLSAHTACLPWGLLVAKLRYVLFRCVPSSSVA